MTTLNKTTPGKNITNISTISKLFTDYKKNNNSALLTMTHSSWLCSQHIFQYHSWVITQDEFMRSMSERITVVRHHR